MNYDKQARSWLLQALTDIERLGVITGWVGYHANETEIHITYKRQLANDLVVPLLAQWLAIDDGKTRLQAGEYTEKAQELADYLYVIGLKPEAPK